MKHSNPDFYELPIEVLGRHLRQELYAERERDRLVRALATRPTGRTPWRAVAGWIAAHLNGSASPAPREARPSATSPLACCAGPFAWPGM